MKALETIAGVVVTGACTWIALHAEMYYVSPVIPAALALVVACLTLGRLFKPKHTLFNETPRQDMWP